MEFLNTRVFAENLDAKDPLALYKDEFNFPVINGEKVIYFTGNSLGLQPKKAVQYVQEVMDDWASLAVEGHFYASKPWWDYHQRLSAPLSEVVGALPSEVTVMNTLTVNLHLLMTTFYRPNKQRFKIICEEKAFPSDQYMIASQIQSHGLELKDTLVEIKRQDNESNFTTDQILAVIEEHRDSAALILLGGINYYTGQVFDIATITKAAKQAGLNVGWDLAHAAGNIALELHKWEVDFAAWCSYKYMNAGPGSASGCFVHEKYHHDRNLIRLAGWWGHNKEKRFLMEPNFDPIPSAEGWQISNPSILSLAPYLASLEIFQEVGMEKIVAKRDLITAYLCFILTDVARRSDFDFEIITPQDTKQRGSQLSVLVKNRGRELFTYLVENGVMVDWREPNVIRMAPVPLYTSFMDIYNFGQLLLRSKKV